MVKHNNQIPNLHFHKKYCASSRGPLKVKLSLDQATRKKSRRLKRAAKAAAIAPRPMQKLRPVVHCPTQKYNAKVRLGRGFTLEELKAAGVDPKYARTVGICVDLRRTNRCEESLTANTDRLKDYMKNLVVWTKKSQPTDAVPQLTGDILPLVKPKQEIVMEKITDEMKNFKAFTTMRVERKLTKVAGQRYAVSQRKEKK
uniref:60S ribosomal protein L13 n=1 Tax=Grammatophora oceanica TaxID=210454 RepID=A0A7S1UUC5_9STRA|mmetsp:Transcript_19918/g.29485  ORF Transcript_19918/g.29485 Transcript_19918/m.29485 type:complete len:200 (+) Transcript_19918:87-686(+)|eukprot:CAMPEP_0194026238 /NCGR_PEP_ID=MMETSP0009_2-20130614/559_1 /TAXON_ID=210454 /ORGANISM="Grammatophora oceanica, Strain CCMP 410" /LENGTH=199 /DNA_ID=CAMNT_0038664821 /DNA_START=61 /DNA_END=660 /DNA_ORIENTATION=+